MVFLLLLGSARTASAQPAPGSVKPGERVRVSILVPDSADVTGFRSGERLTGNVLAIRPTELALSDDEPAIPWTIVERLEVSAGRHGNAGQGALIGSLIGLVAGVVVGVTQGKKENGGEGDADHAAEWGVALGLGGLLAGAGIGAIVGGSIKHDDWMPVATP